MTQIGSVSLQLEQSAAQVPLLGAISVGPDPNSPNRQESGLQQVTTKFLINGEAPATWAGSFSWGFQTGLSPQQLKVIALRDVIDNALNNIASKKEPFTMFPKFLGENFGGFADGPAGLPLPPGVGPTGNSTYRSTEDAIAAAAQALSQYYKSAPSLNPLFAAAEQFGYQGGGVDAAAQALARGSAVAQNAAIYKTSLLFSGATTSAIQGIDERSIEFQELWTLVREPVSFTEDAIIISDDRWRWDRVNVNKRYNLIRRANDRYIFGGSVQFQNILSDAQRYFLEETLNQGRPWTCIEIIEDILENDLGYPTSKIKRERLGQVLLTNYIPQNVSLDGVPAPTALARFCNEGNVDIYLDKDGSVVIFPVATIQVRGELENTMKAAMDSAVSGAIDFQDKTLMRPDKVIVEFEQEREVLFTYEEGAKYVDDSSVSPARQIEGQEVKVENVTRTVINDQIPGVPRGVYVTIEDALAEFGLSLDDLRNYYGMGSDALVMDKLRATGAARLDQDLVLVWNTIMRDYRSLFRIPGPVMRNIASVKPVLAAIVNPETGMRAPAEVFSTVTWLSRLPRYVTSTQSERSHGAITNSFDTDRPKSNGTYQPLPASVQIEDPDLGVFRVTYFGELNLPGYPADVLPGEPADPSFFTDSLAEGESVLSRQAIQGQYGLKEEWKIGVVLSVISLNPNNNSRLWWEEVDPPSGITPGAGPPIFVRTTLDSYRKTLPDSLKPWRNQTYSREAGPVNPVLVRGLAQNEGNRVWYSFADHPIGQVTARIPIGGRGGSSDLLESVKPYSTISRVAYTVDGSGGFYVTIVCAPSLQPPDIRNLLSQELLSVTMQQIDFNWAVNGQKVGY